MPGVETVIAEGPVLLGLGVNLDHPVTRIGRGGRSPSHLLHTPVIQRHDLLGHPAPGSHQDLLWILADRRRGS
jgi:hypothetical protein